MSKRVVHINYKNDVQDLDDNDRNSELIVCDAE